MTPDEERSEIERLSGPVAVELARMGGKLDTAVSEQRATLNEHERWLTRLDRDADLLEGRVRVVENRVVVTPKSMWAGVTVLLLGLTMIVAIAAVIVDAIFG